MATAGDVYERCGKGVTARTTPPLVLVIILYR